MGSDVPSPDKEAPDVPKSKKFESDADSKLIDLSGITGNQDETKKRIQETGVDDDSFVQLPEDEEEENDALLTGWLTEFDPSPEEDEDEEQ